MLRIKHDLALVSTLVSYFSHMVLTILLVHVHVLNMCWMQLSPSRAYYF